MSLRDVGWLWEGQGFNLGTPPSIYGLGQGASYFGFRNVCFMFHECDEHAMHLLNNVDQVSLRRYQVALQLQRRWLDQTAAAMQSSRHESGN